MIKKKKGYTVSFIPKWKTVASGHRLTVRKTFRKKSTVQEAVRKLKKRGDKAIRTRKA